MTIVKIVVEHTSHDLSPIRAEQASSPHILHICICMQASTWRRRYQLGSHACTVEWPGEQLSQVRRET